MSSPAVTEASVAVVRTALARASSQEGQVVMFSDLRRGASGRRTAILLACAAGLALILLAALRPVVATLARSDDPRDCISDARELALSDLHHLHLVVSGQEWDWNETTQQWDQSQARWHARAWYEGGDDERFRVDYDPAIRRWSGGPSRFSETCVSMSWDGKLYRKFDHGYSSGRYGSRLSESRPYYPDYVPFEGLDGRSRQKRKLELLGRKIPMGTTPGQLHTPFDIAEHGGIRHAESTKNVAFSITQDAHGMTVVEMRYGTSQTTRFVLDPSKHYATVSRRVDFDADHYLLDQVTAWKQITGSLWLPTAFEKEVRTKNQTWRATITVESVGYFAPQHADAIFTMQDIDTARSSPTSPAGPSFADRDGPP